jgi:hypothetical protein
MAAAKGIDREKVWQFYCLGLGPTAIGRNMGIHRNVAKYHIDALIKEKGERPDNRTPHNINTEAA